MNPTPDIVISGMGILSSIGCGNEAFTAGLRQARCGIHQVPTYRTGEKSTSPAGFIDDLDALCAALFDSRKARRWDPLSSMTMAACVLALQDANCLDTAGQWIDIDPARVGLVLANGWGGIQTAEQFFHKAVDSGPQSANPSLFPETVPNAASAHVTIELGIKGPYTTITQKHLSVEAALDFALGMFAKTEVDIVVTGGLEDLSYWCSFGHEHAGALRSDQTLRPFDLRRRGTCLGEGGAVFVLERRERALRRGIKTHGMITGTLFSGVPTRPGTWPTDEKQVIPLAKRIGRFLRDRQLTPAEISSLSACALGAKTLDRFEAALVHQAFGSHTPVWALAGATGSFACLGGLRIAAGLLSLQHNFIPATVGLETPENPALDYVCASPRLKAGQRIFHQTLADGGGYGALLLEKA